MIKKALYDLLAADSGITGDLATYVFSTGSAAGPAIFTGRKIPDNAELPCIFISGVTATGWGTRDKKGGEFLADVQVIGEKTDSMKALEDLAKAVWLLLDRAALTLSGFTSYGCLADPPMQTNALEAYPALTIKVKAFLTEA